MTPPPSRIQYTRGDGCRKALTLGCYGANNEGVSLSDARKKARAMMVAVDSGGDPARAARDRKKAPTFAEVAEEWLAYRKADPNHNPHSLGDDRGMLKRHINPVLGHLISRTSARQISCILFV